MKFPAFVGTVRFEHTRFVHASFTLRSRFTCSHHHDISCVRQRSIRQRRQDSMQHDERRYHVLSSCQVACSLHAGVTHVVLDATDGSRHTSIRSRIRCEIAYSALFDCCKTIASGRAVQQYFNWYTAVGYCALSGSFGLVSELDWFVWASRHASLALTVSRSNLRRLYFMLVTVNKL